MRRMRLRVTVSAKFSNKTERKQRKRLEGAKDCRQNCRTEKIKKENKGKGRERVDLLEEAANGETRGLAERSGAQNGAKN